MKNNEIKMVENLKRNKKSYTIRWQMTTLCNYECDFCIQGNRKKHIDKSRGENSEIREKICDNIIYFIEKELNGKYENLQIYLIGGEVTILSDFTQLLKKLYQCKFDGDIEYFITTNLSSDVNKLQEIKDIFSGHKNKKYMRTLYISASFYKTYTTLEEFVKKLKVIHNPRKIKNHVIKFQKRFRNKDFLHKLVFNAIKILEKKNSNVIVTVGYPLVEDNDYQQYQDFIKKNKKYADEIHYIVIRKYGKSISNNLK